MQLGTPSRTAWAAAVHRAAHQVLEDGRIFADPLAVRILGPDAEAAIRASDEWSGARRMRVFIAVRHRFAEDALAAAIGQGVRQLVMLGAGLDTCAYRGKHADDLRIFEVDHPDTQSWKRDRLSDAGIAAPEALTYAPVDFERETLAAGLAAAGFDSTQQTFFTWLGVVPYLTEAAVVSTLRFIAELPGGAHVVFDYSDPPEDLSPDLREHHDRRAERVAAAGEPWLTYFSPGSLRGQLTSAGFVKIEDLGPNEIAQRYFPHLAASPPRKGGHVIYAATVAG